MRIGLFGGTFDPPHSGHVEVARAALSNLELDEVVWMPAHRNPQKKGRLATPAKQRLEMVRLAIQNEPEMAVSDLELQRGGPSYTVDTLFELQAARPGEYWLLMGADALLGFHEWKAPERILRMCRIGATVRPPLNVGDLRMRVPADIVAKTDFFEMPAMEVSGTDLRERIVRGRPTFDLIPAPVLDYIRRQKLYS